MCTENLTPWLKLLPCRDAAGLATLLLDRQQLFGGGERGAPGASCVRICVCEYACVSPPQGSFSLVPSTGAGATFMQLPHCPAAAEYQCGASSLLCCMGHVGARCMRLSGGMRLSGYPPSYGKSSTWTPASLVLRDPATLAACWLQLDLFLMFLSWSRCSPPGNRQTALALLH